MSDRPNYPEQIGDALARAIDPEADAAKRAIWRKVAGVLWGVFDLKAIDVLDDPTVVEAYMPDGGWCWARSMAWQVDRDTGFPLALWLKVSDASKDWERIWPAGVASDEKVAVDSDDALAGGSGYAEDKIVGDGETSSTSKGTGAHGKTLIVHGPPKSTTSPLPDGDVAVLGDEGKWADGKHVHPKARPVKVRYYLSDTHGEGDYTGHLLLTENPYPLEENAIDYTHDSEWAVFVSGPDSPGLASWPGGVVHAHLRVKLVNSQVGRTYRLYTGNGDIVYTSMIWDWTHSDTYQVKESAPDEPSITETYATLDFDLPVAALAAGADGRLGLNMRLRVFVDGSESTFSGEQIVIRIGGDNASYLDTLFTPDGGFSGVHNDLDGRSADNAHPFAAITPGRLQTPSNAPVTTSAGLFAIPTNSNYATLLGTEDLIGCSTAGWTGNSYMEVMVMSGRKFLKSQSVPEGYAPFIWGSAETGYGSDYDVIDAYPYSVYRFRLIANSWRLCSSFNM